MALNSKISLIVANQLGKIEGELQAKVQSEATRILNKFANQCPTTNELVVIVNTRNSLLRGINQFQKTSNRFSSFANTIRNAISVARRVLSLLLVNPTPVATGIPPSDYGGLATAKTAGQLTSLANRLYKINRILEELEGDVNSIERLVSGVTPGLDNIRDILQSVNEKTQDCVEQQSSDSENDTDAQNIKDLLNKIQPLENTGSEGTPNEEYFYKAANGKNYTLAIIQEKQGEGPVPRRIAVAKDNLGVIILRGQPSFSSDTQVLLDELKFRIDNQLP